jgi:dTDP-4-dehydrorhamnose reductase
MGRGLGPTRNFVDWFLDRLHKKQEIPLFQDEIRTATFVEPLADMLWQIALSSEQGIFHLCGEQAVNRYELGRMFCDHLGYGHEQLKAISLNDMTDCRRPVDVSQVSTRQINGIDLRITGIGKWIPDILNGSFL